MSKLTKEILSAYLPWETNVLVDTLHWHEKREPFVAKLIGIFDFEHITVKYLDEFDSVYTDNMNRFKLCLRPLDLTKEIEHNGERFVPIEKIEEFSDGSAAMDDWFEHINDLSYKPNEIDFNQSPYMLLKPLLMWHFNVFNLDDDCWVNLNEIEK